MRQIPTSATGMRKEYTDKTQVKGTDMTRYILIADSGSTKTDWILTSQDNGILQVNTTGINPVRDSQDAILRVLTEELLPRIPHPHQVAQAHFYGAGCIQPFCQAVSQSLSNILPRTEIHVGSDLLGAARALCGNEPGIACILGTGSNSCLYDGKEITLNTPPLGYILGDEGSGAVLGRTLVGNLLKGMLPQSLLREFLDNFHLTQQDIISRVYRSPMPNRFLASLVPFIDSHRHHDGIHQMLVEQFRLFFSRNIKAYAHPEMHVNFVGSIAHVFTEELTESAHIEGFEIGKIIQRPIMELTDFHKKRLKLS